MSQLLRAQLTSRPSLRAVFTKQSSTPAYLPVLSPAAPYERGPEHLTISTHHTNVPYRPALQLHRPCEDQQSCVSTYCVHHTKLSPLLCTPSSHASHMQELMEPVVQCCRMKAASGVSIHTQCKPPPPSLLEKGSVTVTQGALTHDAALDHIHR